METALMAVMTDVRKLEIREYPIPEPGEGQILIKDRSDSHMWFRPAYF
ncbi:hypothetical protein [Luxibacter massiliensis]|nr:hypothetical protein [Luxibacter massiliensis]